MATKRKTVLKYEERLIELVDQVADIQRDVHGSLFYNKNEFQENMRALPFMKRLDFFLKLTGLQRDLLGLLQKCFPLKAPKGTTAIDYSDQKGVEKAKSQGQL